MKYKLISTILVALMLTGCSTNTVNKPATSALVSSEASEEDVSTPSEVSEATTTSEADLSNSSEASVDAPEVSHPSEEAEQVNDDYQNHSDIVEKSDTSTLSDNSTLSEKDLEFATTLAALQLIEDSAEEDAVDMKSIYEANTASETIDSITVAVQKDDDDWKDNIWSTEVANGNTFNLVFNPRDLKNVEYGSNKNHFYLYTDDFEVDYELIYDGNKNPYSNSVITAAETFQILSPDKTIGLIELETGQKVYADVEAEDEYGMLIDTPVDYLQIQAFITPREGKTLKEFSEFFTEYGAAIAINPDEYTIQ